MSPLVERTCTELPSGGPERSAGGDSQPLSAYRSLPAYVLLGDPGAGKTTEFIREFEELGDSAAYVKARDFITDVVPYQQLQGRTVFIDGLDEMRAGAALARTPLDEIRRRLVGLGRPSFRISCREADWLGPNDRQSLETVSPNSAITVLLLDELSEKASRELLAKQNGIDNAYTFEAEAGRQGLDAMLRNPQLLKLLTQAVGSDGAWPGSRLETLGLACRKMATEYNDEHLHARHHPPSGAVLGAAGHLCALVLLCGFEGYELASTGLATDSEPKHLVPVDDLADMALVPSREVVEAALATNLFKPDGETGRVPSHRLIAEFLAGRYLADLIKRGLSARRVVALMTSPTDGRVVTALRGLSAWLAAQPGEARRQLIDADPVGVGLYGDIGDFSSNDRERLLRSLVEFAEQGSLFGHARQDGRADGYRDDTARAFRCLASADMLVSIRSLLRSPISDAYRDRTAVFALTVLSEAEESERESLAVLAPEVAAIMRDAERPPWVTIRALDAYARIAPVGRETDQTLVTVLNAIQDGSISDVGDDLRRSLLKLLYPTVIGPAELWSYALPRVGGHLPSGLGNFWDRHVIRESPDEHITELLDALCADAPRLIPALTRSFLDDLPIQLLDRVLHAFGDTLDTERLLDWLDVAGSTQGASLHEDETRSVRRWLESRPQAQKSVFLAWLRRGVAEEPNRPYRHWFCDALHRSRLPADFGPWCLDQAVTLQHDEPLLAEELLTQAYAALDDPSIREGLTLADMHDRVSGGALTPKLEELHNRHSTGPTEDDEWRQERKQHQEKRAEQKRQRRKEWGEGLRSALDDLHANRLFAPNLDALAKVYLAMFTDADNEASGRQRIRDFIGDDEALVDAVMAAIREAVFRDDIPGVDDTLTLHSGSKHSWLAYPVLASLHLLNEENPDRLDTISSDRKRSALAIHYCVPSDDESPPWHDRWFQKEPALVLEVLQRCATRAVRAGAEFVPCLNTLDILDDHNGAVPAWAINKSTAAFETRAPTPRSSGYHGDLVRDTRLGVLASIPTRASNQQMRLLDNLLARAMQHPDTVSLRELAATKLSRNSMNIAQRVRWLTVDALMSPHPSLQPVKTYINTNNTQVRVRHFAEFLRHTSRHDDMARSVLAGVREPEVLRDAIETLGPSFGPVQWGESGYVTLGMEMSDLMDNVIEQLGALADNDADRAFKKLIKDPLLKPWRDRLTWAHERQRVVHRDASYRHPSITEAQSTLKNEAPASAADLAALLQDRIADISADMRDSNANPWRNYWNEDRYRRPTTPKPEESCRDALAEALRSRLLPLSPEVSVHPEAHYAAEARADLSVRSGDLDVPVEIKKNSHRDLWSALRRQLINKYMPGRATSGYGIYLVLWFGADVTKTHRGGSRPETPEELRRLLEQELTLDEARKISVIVIDVTKPGEPPLPRSGSTLSDVPQRLA